MKLSRQASNSSPGEFMSNLQTWECRHTAGGPGSAREGAGSTSGRLLSARPRRPATAPAEAHTELPFCFTLRSLQLLHLPLTVPTNCWRKPRKTPKHWEARTGNSILHRVLGAAARPYAWGTGRNLPWAKGIPKGFPCLFAECIIPKHKHKNTECPPIYL